MASNMLMLQLII